MEPDHIHPWRTGCTEEFASLRVGCLFQRHISQLLLSHTGNRSGKTCKFHDPLRVTNKFDKIESTSKHIFSYQSSSFHKNFLIYLGKSTYKMMKLCKMKKCTLHIPIVTIFHIYTSNDNDVVSSIKLCLM